MPCRKNAHVKIVSVLCENGIVPVLLKGQGNAQYYPNPEMRQFGDVDLYIGSNAYHKAYDILKGIATRIDGKESLNNGKHFHMYYGPVQFDIHRHNGMYALPRYDTLFQEETFKGLTKNLESISIRNISIFTPSNEYNAYYIFSHLFNHYLISGIGLRHLRDLMMSACKILLSGLRRTIPNT